MKVSIQERCGTSLSDAGISTFWGSNHGTIPTDCLITLPIWSDISLESAAPSALFDRQHCYLLNCQHISTGTHKQFRVAQRISNACPPYKHTRTRRSNPTSFKSPIHDCASKIPSIARRKVDITSTANQYLQGHPFQKPNQNSSVAPAAPLADSKIILDR